MNRESTFHFMLRINPLVNHKEVCDFKLLSSQPFDVAMYNQTLALMDEMMPIAGDIQQVIAEATQRGNLTIKFYNENDPQGPITEGCWVGDYREIKIKLLQTPLQTLSVLLWELCNAANPGLQVDSRPLFADYNTAMDFAFASEKEEFNTLVRSNKIVYDFLVKNEDYCRLLLSQVKGSDYDALVAEYGKNFAKTFQQYLDDDPEHVQLYATAWQEWQDTNNKPRLKRHQF